MLLEKGQVVGEVETSLHAEALMGQEQNALWKAIYMVA